jgi:hypothetical protein
MKKLNIIKSLAHKKWGADQQTLLRIHQMIILPTTLKTLGHKRVRLVLGTFAICRRENVLHEVGISESKTQDTMRSYFINNKIHDERNQTKNNQTNIP